MEDLYENVEDCRILINNSQLDEEVIKLCDKINTKIDEKYGSVARFSRTVNVPYSTLNCILKNGLSNSKFSMVLDICRRLRVDIFDIEKYGIKAADIPIISKISSLDERGIGVISGIIEEEYKRCIKIITNSLQINVIMLE